MPKMCEDTCNDASALLLFCYMHPILSISEQCSYPTSEMLKFLLLPGYVCSANMFRLNFFCNISFLPFMANLATKLFLFSL